MSDFRNKLNQLREEKGKTAQEVADAVGITRISIQNYEKGKRNPDINTLNRLADYFGVTTDYLLGRSLYRTEEDAILSSLGLSKQVHEKLKNLQDIYICRFFEMVFSEPLLKSFQDFCYNISACDTFSKYVIFLKREIEISKNKENDNNVDFGLKSRYIEALAPNEKLLEYYEENSKLFVPLLLNFVYKKNESVNNNSEYGESVFDTVNSKLDTELKSKVDLISSECEEILGDSDVDDSEEKQ